MSLYEFTNISVHKYRVTFHSHGGRPLRIALGYGERAIANQADVGLWPPEALQELAGLVQSGTLRMEARNTVHVVQDRGYQLPVSSANRSGALNLVTAVEKANEFKRVYNLHIAATEVHTVADATNVITAADVDPADDEATQLADLITLLTEARADYNAHIILGASHPVVDTFNAVTAAVPSDLASCLLVLDELYPRFNQHQLQFVDDGGAGPLTPTDILAL